MIDIIEAIDRTHRETGPGRIPAGDGRRVVLRRTYDAPVDDVWDACTNADRIPRWFLPVSGHLRLGGRYQLEGNAGGEILRCEPPELLAISWVYGETATEADVSEVEVRLRPTPDGATELELVHTAVVPEQMWQEFGPGAVGVGWDLGLLGLALYLGDGEVPADPVAWQLSAEGKDFVTRSATAWGAALEASGVDPAEAADTARRTTAFYTADPGQS